MSFANPLLLLTLLVIPLVIVGHLLAERRRMTAHPTDYLRRIWYDCITYDLGALRYLISVVGADRVLFGTDWPHQVHDIAGSLANTAALPPDQRDAIRGSTAVRLFGL